MEARQLQNKQPIKDTLQILYINTTCPQVFHTTTFTHLYFCREVTYMMQHQILDQLDEKWNLQEQIISRAFQNFIAVSPPCLHLFSLHSFYLDSVVTDADRVFDTENARSITNVLPNWGRFTNNMFCLHQFAFFNREIYLNNI